MGGNSNNKTEPLAIATIILGMFVILMCGAFAILVRAITDNNHKIITAVSEEKVIIRDRIGNGERIIIESYPVGNTHSVDDEGNIIAVFTNANDLT